jgi:hypothetical protein
LLHFYTVPPAYLQVFHPASGSEFVISVRKYLCDVRVYLLLANEIKITLLINKQILEPERVFMKKFTYEQTMLPTSSLPVGELSKKLVP